MVRVKIENQIKSLFRLFTSVIKLVKVEFFYKHKLRQKVRDVITN